MATAPDPSSPLRDVPPVAFVLSGGGNLGALQVGMLRALLEHGVRPDMVIGCSVGAINGAGFADAPTLEGVADLERVWLGLDGQDLLPTGWSNAVSLARRGEAIHDHSGLRRMADDALRASTFDDLDVHFECVATDVAGAREVWFDSGPLVEAILASSALPAIYPAVEIDGVRYLDGGIVNDVPMSRAVELGARTMYILQVGSFTRPRPEPRRPLDVAVQAYWVARHHRFKRELGALPPDVEVHVLPTGETPRMRFNDFTHSGTLVSRAHAAASAYLDDLAAGIPTTADLDGVDLGLAVDAGAVMGGRPGASEGDGRGRASGDEHDRGDASDAPGMDRHRSGAPHRPRRTRLARRRNGVDGGGRTGSRGTGSTTGGPRSAQPNGDHDPSVAEITQPNDVDTARGTPVRDDATGTSQPNGPHGQADRERGRGDGAERLPGVRRWARATRLRRSGERPARRPPVEAAVTTARWRSTPRR